NLSKGLWSVELTGKSNASAPGFLLFEGDERTELASYATHARQIVGETFGLTAQLTGIAAGDKALVGAAAGRIERAVLKVTGPDGSSESLAMFDDGLHGDGLAGDGVFGAGF